MTAAGLSLKGPFHPGVQKIPTDISLASVLLGTGTTMLVHITTEWQMCARCVVAVKCLSQQLKYMHPFPFLHLYWLRGRADVPWSHPHGILTPSCHSNDNSFIYHHDSCCTPDCLTGPGQLHHSLAQPPIHFYLHCQFPKFHLPIIHTFFPLYYYSCKHLIIPYLLFLLTLRSLNAFST